MLTRRRSSLPHWLAGAADLVLSRVARQTETEIAQGCFWQSPAKINCVGIGVRAKTALPNAQASRASPILPFTWKSQLRSPANPPMSACPRSRSYLYTRHIIARAAYVRAGDLDRGHHRPLSPKQRGSQRRWIATSCSAFQCESNARACYHDHHCS